MKIISSIIIGALSAWIVSSYTEHHAPPLVLVIFMLPVYILTRGIFGHANAYGEIFTPFALGVELTLIVYLLFHLLGKQRFSALRAKNSSTKKGDDGRK